MMMALAVHRRSALRAGSRRRDARGRGGRRRRRACRASARASPTARSPSRRPPKICCRACATPGGGCQFLGTAATSQVVAEALGMSLPHSALAPSGHPIWLDMARRSARAVLALEARGLTMRDILTDASLRNAMVVHAAFGGSTNLILHLPAMAHAAGLRRPTAAGLDRHQPPRRRAWWMRCPTARARSPPCRSSWPAASPKSCCTCGARACSIRASLTVSGETLDAALDWWEQSERRAALRRRSAGARRHRSRRCDHGPCPRRAAPASLPRSPSRTAIWRRKAR